VEQKINIFVIGFWLTINLLKMHAPYSY